MSVPYKYIGTPLEELISLGYYDPEARRIKAIRGRDLHVRSLDWQLEGPLRMLFHVLDEEVAKDPKNLIVYGGTGKAARSWDDFEAIVSSLMTMESDDTLVIQSGQPIAIFKLDKRAPRVVMSNAMLVPKWADWRTFRELEARGLISFHQMTAGCWAYIGTQGILQGTYETIGYAAERHFGSLEGRLMVSAGLGEMGGAQPLAVKMLGGVALIADVDRRMIERRINTAYLDAWTDDVDKAISMALAAKEKRQATSIGVLANAVDLLERLVREGVTPDLLTDQTPAHDPLAYVPQGLSLEEANKLKASDPDKYVSLASSSMAKHVQLMLELQRRGAVTFDYGNNLRKQAFDAGVEDAFKIPGQMEFLRPMFEEGRGPFRWISLTGEPNDIYRLDDVLLSLFERNARLARWIRNAHKYVKFQGLPARVVYLGYGERALFGKTVSQMVRRGELNGPMWFGRDHLDSGSVASPYRETEAMLDGSDAIGDWPILNYALNTASGATWTCFHHGGGTGIGYSIHAGFGMVVDGSELAEEKAMRVFTVDPGSGVVRHAHAGYPKSLRVARERGIRIPIMDRLEEKSRRVIEEAHREGRASDYTYDRVKKDLEEYDKRVRK
ncbi:urocanate hydratase [Thermocladium modestius]|uniref:Probable urocanate hydratase n=1 Tax=Thermocladium modestius TaxID=62609 RepID=A0A830GU56_9CREN|nr:urocanate hydratase [Thermocladium modestius]GGP19979.1 urocanate hydratase [Thermocladium modestius]